MKSLRREVDVIRQKTKRENDQIRKNRDLSDAEFVRKNNELEAKNLRLQGSILHRDFFPFSRPASFLKTYSGECMRLGDVIEKTQSELNTSKIQLSQIQRQEAQSRQELDSIRSLTNNKDKRGKELQVYKYFNRVNNTLRNRVPRPAVYFYPTVHRGNCF